GTGAAQHVGKGGGALDVQVALPETLENLVVVGAKAALPLGVQQPDAGQCGVPDLLRPANGETDAVRLSTHVHVAVADPTPLMGIAILCQDAALGVDPGAAQIGGNVEDVGQPVDLDPGVTLQPIGRILRQIGVGTLVIDIERQAWSLHARCATDQ